MSPKRRVPTIIPKELGAYHKCWPLKFDDFKKYDQKSMKISMAKTCSDVRPIFGSTNPCFKPVNYSLAPPKFSHLRPLLTCAPLDSLTPQTTHLRPPPGSLAHPGLPQCHHLKSNSLNFPPLPSRMPSSKIYLFI